MATAKEHITEIIKRQPDDSSYDEIVRELAFDLWYNAGSKTQIRVAQFPTKRWNFA